MSLPGKLPVLGAVLCDVHDFVFKDEEIWFVFAGQPDHVPVVIFNPAADDFAVGQLDADGLLLFA